MIQDKWRACNNCGGLFLEGGASVCAAGGKHDEGVSAHYILTDNTFVQGSGVGDMWGVIGVSKTGPGVRGQSDATGVFGEGQEYGVKGNNTADGDGVAGISASGTGVFGEGPANGVHGKSGAGRAVYGENTADGDGVAGISASGTGVFGEGPENGVHGKSATGYAVYGEQTAAGDGVHGLSTTGTGVAGLSGSGSGVFGRSDSGHAGYFDGDVKVTGNVHCDKDIYLTNADCAEEWDLAPGQRGLPGSVMVLDDAGRLEACASAYDHRVVGVLSGAGRYRPAIVLDRQGDAVGRGNLAVLGKVYCLADAAYGPILVGDLLTTSPTPAHAMRSADRDRSVGSGIGKALGSLTAGKGLIPVLVALQ
jgi:hypothetical protein